MKKIALALAASLASAPAMAGVYLNAESNASYTGNDFTDNLHPPDRFFRTDLQAYKRYENYTDENFELLGRVYKNSWNIFKMIDNKPINDFAY